MATVYSLLCWGGKDGKAATMTIASPCVVTITNHGLRTGKGVIFTTTGAVPTGITVGATYYVRRIDDNTFHLYDTPANAENTGSTTGRVNTSGTQSGTHTAKGAYWSGLTTEQKARYGVAGSERAYASMQAWNTARSGASGLDVEVCEIGEAFTDILSTHNNITIPAGAWRVESKVNGVRSAAYHWGFVSTATTEFGYVIRQTGTDANGLNWQSRNGTVDGITVRRTAQGSAFLLAFLNSRAINCISVGAGATAGYGFHHGGVNSWAVNCIAQGYTVGWGFSGFTDGITVLNCLSTKNTTGMEAVASLRAYIYNTISVGNTTNWGASTPNAASNNAGLSGQAWITGSNPRYTIATTDFVDHANNDYRPAGVTSVQVEQAAVIFGAYEIDVADNFRPSYPGPNYNTAVAAGSFVAGLSYTIATVGTTDFTAIGASANTVGVTFKATGVGSGTGTATLNAQHDIGPYEFDLGYGTWPSSLSRGLAFTGLQSGSKVKVFLTGTDTEKFSASSSGTSETWSETTSGSVVVDYVIMKENYELIRVTGVTVTASDSGPAATPINQVPARWYQASSGLTIGTNVFANASTKKWGLTAGSTLQNLACYLLEQWIALGDSGEAYANKPFPIAANGPNSFSWLDGWEADLATYPNSLTNLSRDGMRYISAAGSVTAIWAAILSANVPAGARVRFRQGHDLATQSAAVTSGNMDQLVQVYGDATHGNFDYRGFLDLKVQESGYDEATADAVALYGALEDQLYVVGLAPTPNGLATGDPGVTGVTITDHGASPVSWNPGAGADKAYSITIADSGSNSGTAIMRWLRWNFEQGGTFQGADAFTWHDLVRTNGTKFKTVRGMLYGDVGAALKGVRVIRGASTPHPDFDLFTADDGTTAAPPSPPVTLTVAANVSLAGAVVSVFDLDGTPSGSYGTLLGGAAPSAGATVDVVVSAGNSVSIQILKDGYIESNTSYTMPGVSATATIELEPDPNA